MIVTLYATIPAEELTPGDVILDVTAHDRDNVAPTIDRLPTAHIVDEISDRLDGRKVYTLPAYRTEGKRRVWTFKPDDYVNVELDGRTAADTLRMLAKHHQDSIVSIAVLPGVADTIEEQISE